MPPRPASVRAIGRVTTICRTVPGPHGHRERAAAGSETRDYSSRTVVASSVAVQVSPDRVDADAELLVRILGFVAFGLDDDDGHRRREPCPA